VTRAPRFALVLLVDDIGACPALAALAERAGFEMLGIVDSQSVSADAYVALAVAAQHTARIRLGPADQLLLTAITPDPRRFIERWSTEVMPRCLAAAGRTMVTSPSTTPTGGSR
jgi:Luciferase-like monooxygenase